MEAEADQRSSGGGTDDEAEAERDAHQPEALRALLGRRDVGEIRGAASIEQQGDIAFQIGLIALDRETIVRPAISQVSS